MDAWRSQDWNTFKRSTFLTRFHHQHTWRQSHHNSESVITVIDNHCTWSYYQQTPTMIFHRVGELGKRAALGVFMYFVSPYIFCEGVPSLHSHTSGLSWSGPNYHSSNRPALPSPTLPAIEHPPSFRSTSCEIEEKVKNTSSQSPQPVDILGCM